MSNSINNNIDNNKIANKEKEIVNNINYIKAFVNKLTSSGEQELENDISKIKTILQKNKENLIYYEHIFRGLDNYRSHGNYILNEKSYEYFLNLFIFILDNFNNNDFIIKNIINFSQTFYKIRQGNKNPKHYILYSISNHSIFNKSETWNKIINYSLASFSVNKDLSVKIDKEQKEKKLDEKILNILVENLSIMKLFRVNDKIFNEVKNYYTQVYSINKELIKKEINYFYKENNFSVNEENEKELIKGEEKDFVEKNLKEDKDIINEEKAETNIRNEEDNEKNIIKEKIEDEEIKIEKKGNNENKIIIENDDKKENNENIEDKKLEKDERNKDKINENE
jgi:hypothetical protein